MYKICKEFYLKYYLELRGSKNSSVTLKRSLNNNWGYFALSNRVLDLESQCLFIIANPL